MTEVIPMKKVKITVLQRNFYQNLADEYGVDGYAPCEMHEPGQVFYSNGWQKPKGLCDNAWKCMQDYVLACAMHAGPIYGKGVWCKQDNLVIVGCNDGLRTVIFKVEGTDETAEVFEEN